MKHTITALLLFLITFSSYALQTAPITTDVLRNKIQFTLDSIYDEANDFGGATVGVALPNGDNLGFAVGYADVTKRIKMTPEDRMLGGSTGKIFVSAATMQLVEKNKLKLNDLVSNYLGELTWYKRIQNHDKITVRNLLQHATGISRYVFEADFQADVHQQVDRVWQPHELLAYVLDKEPLFEPGTGFAYSDTNYILLAMVIEKVTQLSLYEYVEKNILTANQLNGITPQVNRKIPGLVVGYNKRDDEFYPGTVVENGEYKYNVQFEWAGGGYVMNAVDLARAGKLIYEGQLFTSSLQDDFFNGIDAKQHGGTWGLGVHIKETPMGMSYGHSGFFPGYITNMLYFPAYQFAIAIQVNTSDGAKLGLYRKLFQLIPVIVEELKSTN